MPQRIHIQSASIIALSLATASCFSQAISMPTQNPFTALMISARAHADAHHALTPILSPVDASLLTTDPKVDVAALHALNIRVIPWTTNDPAKMKAILALHPDGLISDRPDLLQQALAEARTSDPNIPASFDVEGHRGGRGLRPENTLPAFEAGLDNLINTIETDTGVTADHHSIIWHDQFLNPESCRRADGKPYDFATVSWHRDHTLAELQSTFICDKLKSTRFPDQRNDLTLSPVAVAFASHEHMLSPYSPTYVDQLFRFTAFYADYYKNGPGKNAPNAAARSANAGRVHFNLETKILPFPDGGTTPPSGDEEPTTNHTFGPQLFVDTLTKAIHDAHMETRSDIQSFDFRTLQLVEEQHPDIVTVYLTELPGHLSSDLIPPSLRQPR